MYHQGYGQPPPAMYPQHPFAPPSHFPPPNFHPPPPQQQHQQQPPAAHAGANVAPYLGARISLVSKKNIRYEGRLYTIDPKTSTVALQFVQCFGTEDRAVPAGAFVPPATEIYEFVNFSGNDIQDLHVCEQQPSAPSASATHLREQDPAIVSMQQPAQQEKQKTVETANEQENEIELQAVDAPSEVQGEETHGGGDNYGRSRGQQGQQRRADHDHNRSRGGGGHGQQQQQKQQQQHSIRYIGNVSRGR